MEGMDDVDDWIGSPTWWWLPMDWEGCCWDPEEDGKTFVKIIGWGPYAWNLPHIFKNCIVRMIPVYILNCYLWISKELIPLSCSLDVDHQ